MVKLKAKASFTVEASVVVPIFTLIVVVFVNLAIDCHDIAVANMIKSKAALRYEFEKDNYTQKNMLKSELEEKGNNYMSNRIIMNTNNYEIEEGLVGIDADNAHVTQNNPMDFVRTISSGRKLLNKE